MTREWIEPIYDRTYADIQSVQLDPDQINPKGCWNADDLNRIENNTAYCAEWMLKQKIVRVAPSVTVCENNYWKKGVIPNKTDIDRILNNVRLLVSLSSANPAIADQLPNIYASTQINYILANQIEFALDLMHDQPKLPLVYWKVKLTNGVTIKVIRDDGSIDIPNTSETLVAEDEIVTILGTEYGENAQYQIFNYWSGSADDIGLLEDSEAKETTFTMPYRDVTLTAKFKTHIPRKLTLHSAHISEDNDPTAKTGPKEATYYAGDQIMIIADDAPRDKRFYEWLGTEEGIKNIIGNTDSEDPSTCILTMPDCDVELSSHFINIGPFLVTVNNGSGGGYYEYKDYVYISANDPSSDRYSFSNWSGATSQLNDIYSPQQSFRMPDNNLTFSVNYAYQYSYNTVEIIGGYIIVDGQQVKKAENLRQDTSYTIVADSPEDPSYGFAYWEKDGVGSINSNNTRFTVGDGNATLTAHYAPYRTLTLENIDNKADNIKVSKVIEGSKVSIVTGYLPGEYIFEYWTEAGVKVPDASSSYTFVMPDHDITWKAVYRLRKKGTVTINYGYHTETFTMMESELKTIDHDPAQAGETFSSWTVKGNISLYKNQGMGNYYIVSKGLDATITANYISRIYHHVTVINGSGTGDYYEGGGVYITGDQPPDNEHEFSHWEQNGQTVSYQRTYYYVMKTTDVTFTAHYKSIPKFTVQMTDGLIDIGNEEYSSSALLLRGSSNRIKMVNAPLGSKFLTWEIYVDGILQTEARDLEQPLAETTRLTGLNRNITIKANYYEPSDKSIYTLTIIRKDGSSSQQQYQVGHTVEINASTPDQGKIFYRWEGDVAYLGESIYTAKNYVRMPARNITLTERFEDEGFVKEFDVVMTNMYGQCCYTTSYGESTTEHWDTRWHYPAGTTVKIRAVDIPNEYKFDGWYAVDHWTGESMNEIIADPSQQETTIIVPEKDIDIEPSIPSREYYELILHGGLTSQDSSSAYYHEGDRADIYFDLVVDRDIRYEFEKWTGEGIEDLELFNGGKFDISKAGTKDLPQQIKMPARKVELTAERILTYRVTLINGTIDEINESENYYKKETVINITANDPSVGMQFQYWEGDTNTVANKYDPTTTVTVSNNAIDLTAVYSTETKRNNIGYVDIEIKDEETINNDNIIIISGKIKTGFLLTDSVGRIYLISNVNTDEGTSTIYKITDI